MASCCTAGLLEAQASNNSIQEIETELKIIANDMGNFADSAVKLRDLSEYIARFVVKVRDIARQTNLLALSAAMPYCPLNRPR